MPYLCSTKFTDSIYLGIHLSLSKLFLSKEVVICDFVKFKFAKLSSISSVYLKLITAAVPLALKTQTSSLQV